MPYAYGFCPDCGVKYNVRETSIGTVRRCEACGTKFIVPAPAPPPARSGRGCGTCLLVMLATVGLGAVLAVCAGLAFIGLNADPVPQAGKAPAPVAEPAKKHSAQIPVAGKRKGPPFKLAELCGLNIDQIRSVLGRPVDDEPEPTELQRSVGIDEWSNSYEQGGRELLVTFNARTRQVTDFFIAGDDFDRIVAEWQLDRSSAVYRLESVKALADPGKITGVLVLPIGRQPSVSTAKVSETRTWHDVSGKFKTDAHFVGMTAGVVTLRKADGSTVKVPVEQLSEDDREWTEVRRQSQ